MAREAHAKRARIKKVWRRSSRAHSLRFLGPKQCSLSWPNQGFGAFEKMGSFFVSHFSSNKYRKRIILKTSLTQPLSS
ncbi:hypothetical protein DCAR_0100232 [Daucus carota subsp. sativus]|uniref:Uncharacterized protein n=1 Tax=Daucus carota subsp. sativus TaxID=79200 RepID=A0AAF0W075_DAUCS|nr:hypothetical protein DCAR_0100232 [Daucus carota subsp. sativus]